MPASLVHYRPLLRVLLVAGAALTAGCGRRDPAARFVPSDETARTALAAGLEAWKSGSPAGEVAGTRPLVFVTDSYRDPGERLAGYRILGEVPADAPRCYAVELRLHPSRIEKTRYVVVGIDPLWVFRMEDYQLLSQWDHRMTDEKTAAAAGEPGAIAPSK